MIGLVQRTARARVTVDGAVVGEIGRGLLVFVASGSITSLDVNAVTIMRE